MTQLSEIYIYPVKSLRGIAVKSAEITELGLQYDRNWMLVDANYRFLSQRTVPGMALLDVAIKTDHLLITDRKKRSSPLQVPFQDENSHHQSMVNIWNDDCLAREVGYFADQWFSEVLGSPVKLMHYSAESQRLVDTDYASQGEKVSFSDGFPFLLIGIASLEDLNQRLEQPLPMNRFRPNLVVSGFEPYDEDSWDRFKIGTSVFRAAKPCARCRITTVNQDTGIAGKEPLKTLATYRLQDQKVMFGQNLLCESGSSVSVGDHVEILSKKM